MLDKNARNAAMTTPAAQTRVPIPSADADVAPQRLLAMYKHMLAYLFAAALIVIVILMIGTIPYFIMRVLGYADADLASVFLVVILAGSLGAVFSAMIRLYNFEDLPKVLLVKDLQGLSSPYLLVYSLVPVVVGAISAAVLYVAFAGKLLTSGGPFPEFLCQPKGDNCTTFASFISYWGPAAAVDYAKVLVWGFIAGFAERLVPDTLQSLSRSVVAKETPAKAASESSTAGVNG